MERRRCNVFINRFVLYQYNKPWWIWSSCVRVVLVSWIVARHIIYGATRWLEDLEHPATDWILEIRRGLCGHHSCSAEWYDALWEPLIIDFEFIQSEIDPFVFTNRHSWHQLQTLRQLLDCSKDSMNDSKLGDMVQWNASLESRSTDRSYRPNLREPCSLHTRYPFLDRNNNL